ncbi:MAG: hypothetical protein CVT48_04175 [Thermoplasmata archaeon HGW-Thermoplasmata-1]|nr:MAG: hypothetical protein CVT48_04175 [Thermoplasmata archaeon HGW-Thermoplasmata-1]
MSDVFKEMEKQLALQHKMGSKIIRSSQFNRDLFDKLKEECPNLNEDELIRLFSSAGAGTKNVDAAIIAAAHMIEYNSRHPYVDNAYWFERFLPKAADPKKILGNSEVYAGLVGVISETESEFDDPEVAPTEKLRKRVAAYLKSCKM